MVADLGNTVEFFQIKLSPQWRDDRLHIEKRGSTLIFNGEIIDFSNCYAEAITSQWIVGQPERVDGGWSVTIILPHGAPAPRATRFPKPIVVSDDGPVELPTYEGPDEDQEELFAAVAAKLSDRKKYEITANSQINIPNRLTLAELPDGVYFRETASPFATFPDFGAVVAHIIATVSLLDLEMLRSAVSQHGGDALLAMRSAFVALDRDERRRRKYIKLVAEQTGRQRVWETISWAYKYSEPVYKIRNAFAHHIWGECPLIPNTLLLADPMDRLTGQAARSQLLGHQPAEEEGQALMRIASGEGGSKLSNSDVKVIFDIALARQKNPARMEAFNLMIHNPLDFQAPTAEVWTADDFKNAALAANLAQVQVVGRLQQLSLWLNGLLREDELEPLPTTVRGGR